jgi:DNA-binding MarR family transcriptional regulator
MHITFMNKVAKGAPAAGTDSEKSLLFLVLDVAGQLENRLENELGRSGLSFAKATTLSFLRGAKDPLTLGELAVENACVRSNITQLVDRLEGDGLVRRVNDPDDRRVRRAALTSEGRRACKDACAAITSQEKAVAAALTADEAATLARLLRRLVG